MPPARIMPFIFLPPVEYIFERMALKYLNDVVEDFESRLVIIFSDADFCLRC